METAESAPPAPDSSSSPPRDPMAGVPSGAPGLAELEKQLSESLSAYDETLAGEREELRKERAAARGESTDESEEREASASGAAAGENGAVAGSGESVGGGSGTGGPRTSPTVVSNESVRDGEDVVARQLRKAAEEETDPVLKEKIWEEYRRYTSGQPSASESDGNR
jgi:hypothetical protein